MNSVATVADGQDLLLIAPFEPLPLFGVLAKKGFRHSSREVTQGCWEVVFSRTTNSESQTRNKPDLTNGAIPPSDGPAVMLDVDARGLEPPQPMVRILEALASLPRGAQVRAHTDRRPIIFIRISKNAGALAIPKNKTMEASLPISAAFLSLARSRSAATTGPRANAPSVKLPLAFIITGVLALCRTIGN